MTEKVSQTLFARREVSGGHPGKDRRVEKTIAAMRDPYAILGVRRTAGQEEIKAAWRSMRGEAAAHRAVTTV